MAFFCLVLFSPDIWVLYLFGYLGLKGSRISSENKIKQNKKKTIRKRLGRGTSNTCAEFQGLSQKRRGHLDFCAVKCKTHDLASYLLGFMCIFDLGRKFDLILVLCSQFFEYLRETLYKHALEHLEAPRSEKQCLFFFFLRSMPDHY